MDKQMIEEMAKEREEIRELMKLLDKCVSLNPLCKSEVATVVYGNKYRKIPENAVVLTREEYEKLKDEKADNILSNIDKVFKAEFADMKNSVIRRINKDYAKKVRKETAEKFALKLADYFVEHCGGSLHISLTLQEWYKMIDEIEKELGGE